MHQPSLVKHCSHLCPGPRVQRQPAHMMDETRYASLDMTPELALRQIFVKTRMPSNIRLLVANKGLLDADAWAAVGEALEQFKTNITRLLTAEALGADEAEREGNLICLSATWRKCRALAEGRDTRRARLEEDPLRIPEMGVQEFAQKRVLLMEAHKDILLTDHCEPHKKLVELIDRDFMVHEVILPYDIGELRVKADKIVKKGGLSKTTEALLKVSQDSVPAVVSLDEDAVHRIQAFYIALEYLGHVRYGYFEGKPDDNNVTGGPLTFLRELEIRRKETPGVEFVILVDKKSARPCTS